ncbi:MAG: response regulator [Acidimicrobiales bacterium]
MTAIHPVTRGLAAEGATRGRVLVVAPVDSTSAPLQDLLAAEAHDVRWVTTGAEAITAAAHFRPEVVLLHVDLPDVSGLAVCRALRADQRTADARIVVLGASSSRSELVEGLESGGDDFLDASVDVAELLVRVRAALRRDRSLREASPLTGMPGNARITSMVRRCIDERTTFALVHGDLRNFKAYNDRYGFARGDEALLVLAQIVGGVGSALGGSPRLFGHLGGDDFALVCPAHVVAVVCDEIVERFDVAVRQLYDDDDWGCGYIEVTNRQGERCRYPPLTVALGVATSARRSFASAAEAAAVATEMKQLAKLSGSSAWRIDQRTG